jgi:hypothetical protein
MLALDLKRSILASVIAGLDPAIHEATQQDQSQLFSRGSSSWMRGSSPRMTPSMWRA